MGNIPSQSGMQPLSENYKNLIMHIELAILGSYLLMGTDAPESMGYKLNFGNKVHINPEHDAKAERKKLFNAFSVSVKVTMPL